MVRQELGIKWGAQTPLLSCPRASCLLMDGMNFASGAVCKNEHGRRQQPKQQLAQVRKKTVPHQKFATVVEYTNSSYTMLTNVPANTGLCNTGGSPGKEFLGPRVNVFVKHKITPSTKSLGNTWGEGERVDFKVQLFWYLVN